MGSSIRLADFAIPASRDDTDFQRKAVADLLGRTQLGFPGAQPVSFAGHHLRELQEVDYFMCEKTDGIRCLLYLTQHIHPGGEMVEAQYLIDRKNDYHYVPRDSLHLPRPDDLVAFHTGTLLDGELVRQRWKEGGRVVREQITYLIFDCLAVDGESIMEKDFSKRLARIDQRVVRPMREFKKRYGADVAAQPFQVEMKKMEFPYGVQMMFREVLPALPHGNDGLIFTCKDTRYVAGTDEHILKWKPPEENTIDFRLIMGEFPKREDDGEEDWDAMPEMQLWVNHGDRPGYRRWADLNVTAAEWEAMKGMGEQLDGRVIECFRDPSIATSSDETAGWRAKLEANGTPRFRDDKKDANFIDTVEKVMESIKDAVDQDALIAQAYNIRKAFKERQARREAEEKRRGAEEHQRREEMRRRVEMERVEAAKSQAQGQDGTGAKEAEGVDDDGPRYDED